MIEALVAKLHAGEPITLAELSVLRRGLPAMTEEERDAWRDRVWDRRWPTVEIDGEW